MNDLEAFDDCDLPFAELKEMVEAGIKQMKSGKVSSVDLMQIFREIDQEQEFAEVSR